MSDELSLIDAAHRAADAAAHAIMPYFRAQFSVDNKDAGGFDPVTSADRDAERAIRAVLNELRPDDGIIGEEFDTLKGTSGFDWVIDPIDGTRAFICGTPTWGVLIAVMREGRPIYGLMDQPFIKERFEGGFGRSQVVGPHGIRPLGVAPAPSLQHSKLLSTFPEVGEPIERMAFEAVAQNVQLTRYGLDCYGYGLLAAGQVDLVIEAGLNIYDIAAPLAIVEAAGGIVRNWDGTRNKIGGRIIAASSPHILNEALSLMEPVLDSDTSH